MEFKGRKGWSLRVNNKILTNEFGVKYLSLDDNVSIDCIQVYADSRLKKKQQLIELKANAKLLAAAPDLLDALQPFADLLKQFDGVVGNRPTEGIIQAWHHNTYGESQLTVEMLHKAKQAIEKALK